MHHFEHERAAFKKVGQPGVRYAMLAYGSKSNDTKTAGVCPRSTSREVPLGWEVGSPVADPAIPHVMRVYKNECYYTLD
eukprot:9408969-Pyramimonas_sp.AAC.1